MGDACANTGSTFILEKLTKISYIWGIIKFYSKMYPREYRHAYDRGRCTRGGSNFIK